MKRLFLIFSIVSLFSSCVTMSSGNLVSSSAPLGTVQTFSTDQQEHRNLEERIETTMRFLKETGRILYSVTPLGIVVSTASRYTTKLKTKFSSFGKSPKRNNENP